MISKRCVLRSHMQGSYQVAKWNGTKVSVKILDKESQSDPDTINAFQHELTILEKVRHPNVIQFVGAVTQNLPMMIVLEYHPKGDLGSYLQKKGRLSPSKALRFSLDIARQVQCARNILLDSGGHLKITGFGLVNSSKNSPDISLAEQPASEFFSTSELLTLMHLFLVLTSRKLQVYGLGNIVSKEFRVLTLYQKLGPWKSHFVDFYMAPEVYEDEMYDRSADAYSFGIILYEMIEGVQPFHPKSPEEVVKLMCCEGKRPPFKIKARSYPLDLRELIEECWHPEPVVRPTFSEIIVRLNKIVSNGSKHGWWKDTFKFPWYASEIRGGFLREEEIVTRLGKISVKSYEDPIFYWDYTGNNNEKIFASSFLNTA
ncbi:hypothetical protein Pint_26242 [Pistacia integerrima]|uniref:Uncharacterized protein n=1 Tax=Pistacia integerrima TaxID=434235 RepID=A0ACC0YF99_9ROSI|nr:hypothetical protein Pint_26242 [Pistacia integerrima]